MPWAFQSNNIELQDWIQNSLLHKLQGIFPNWDFDNNYFILIEVRWKCLFPEKAAVKIDLANDLIWICSHDEKDVELKFYYL